MIGGINMATASELILTTGDAPSTPNSDKISIYAKDDNKVYVKTDGGSETELGSGSSAVSGANNVGTAGVGVF